MESKVIAVMGNTGKTIFSFYLAQLLSSAKKRVVMVSTDGSCPVYGTLFPQKKKHSASDKSLGKLLALPVITQGDIFQHTQAVNDNFLMLSYAEHESSMNYPEIGTPGLKAVFDELDKIADYVLVDTFSSGGPIDRYVTGLPGTDRIVITSADLKGFYYRERHPPGKWNLYLQTSKYNSLQDVAASFQDCPNVLLLPYSKSLQAIYNGTDITDTVPSAQYRKALMKIAGELL